MTSKKHDDRRPTRPDTLHPMVFNLWVPAWAIRPGAYAAFAPIAGAMPLWLLLYSRTDGVWRPCYASQSQLGATIGISRGTVARQMDALRRAALVFELDRGRDRRTRRPRPPARWALDPYATELWRPAVEAMLSTIAEEDGHDRRWIHNAVTALEAFERRCAAMGSRIADDMPLSPWPQRKRKRKHKRDRTNAKGRSGAVSQNGARGEGYTREGGDGAVKAVSSSAPLPKRSPRPSSRPTAKKGIRDDAA
jgi:hypothetical protein